MKKITIKIQKASIPLIEELEYLRVIKRLLPPKNTPNPSENECIDETIYFTKQEYGTHKLLFVTTNLFESQASLGYHPDKEDVLLINTTKKVKPLIWVFSKINQSNIIKKINCGSLEENDFIAIKIPFNDPFLSFFTINENMPHYEFTIPGKDNCPSFWVTEPNELTTINIDLFENKILTEF